MATSSRPLAVVTGATGLLGRKVVKAFQMKGWEVVQFACCRADGSHILSVDLNDASEIQRVLEGKWYASHPIQLWGWT